MKFVVLTLFNDMFTSFLNTSIIKRSIEAGKLSVELIDIRDFSGFKNKKVDDTPYGGGNGMVISAEPVAKAIDFALTLIKDLECEIIYMSPRGNLLNYNMCKEFSDGCSNKAYILICGHYEGIDERVLEEYNIKEVSIGDYVLTGGEIAAMVFIDSVTRLVPGIITEGSLIDESHTNKLLEYPQYTKPSVFRGRKVPEVLLSGHDKNITEYRHKKSLELTLKNRPDLLK
ncbi:MAG: tRNA (guanosine(37)-N1)-methyltransferase TrmD [Clostridia bacterium]|nr:tRNA (guanosine(37)-N1)-methyltransferase TrmD [Clostridia bacterium]MDD4386620.1 tRNA (guanosine(37)-N1)-methyltransferase TrmD [Clostridia bacterium]